MKKIFSLLVALSAMVIVNAQDAESAKPGVVYGKYSETGVTPISVNDLEKKMTEAKRDDLKDAIKKTKAMKDSINALFDFMLGKEDKRQGILYEFTTPVSFIGNAQMYIGSSRNAVNVTDERTYKHAEEKITVVLNKVNTFFSTTWKTYRSEMEKVSLSSFKDYPPLKK